MAVEIEDVVIIGAGLAGLATTLGLHQSGIKSLILESSIELRASGCTLIAWTNAWRALDALGVGDSIRHQSLRLQIGEHEVRCIRRNLLLETLARELPQGTIRYSKLVSIEEVAGDAKLLHSDDGSTLKTKVLAGCDGVNSLVAKWLGLKKPSFCGRSATRGFTVFSNAHGCNPDFAQYFGRGFRCGLLPSDEKNIYWFFTWTPTAQEKLAEEDATKMKQFVLNKMRMSKVPEQVAEMVEKSEMASVV